MKNQIQVNDVMAFISRVGIATESVVTRVDYFNNEPVYVFCKKGYALWNEKITLKNFKVMRNGVVIYEN